jgi:hypothetical protein
VYRKKSRRERERERERKKERKKKRYAVKFECSIFDHSSRYCFYKNFYNNLSFGYKEISLTGLVFGKLRTTEHIKQSHCRPGQALRAPVC